MKTLLKYFPYLVILVFLSISCQESTTTKKEESEENHSHEEEGEEQENSITTLTKEQQKTIELETATLQEKDLKGSIKANGFLRVPNNNQANVTALFAGVVRSLEVQIGDRVRKGQIIARIENPEFIRLQEEYLNVNSKITFAEQELTRQKELNQGGAGALKNLQNSESELTSLRTQKASLQKQIQLMGINPFTISGTNLQSKLILTSPISGTISMLYAKIGSYVDPTSPVAEIVDNSQLHLDLQIFEKDIANVHIGQTIDFNLTNNPETRYSAKVFNIDASFKDESKTISVHANVIGNKMGLIDGMNVTGLIQQTLNRSLVAPNDAIVHSEGKYYVFVVVPQSSSEAPHQDPHEHKEGDNHDKKDDHSHDNEEAEGAMKFEKIEVLVGSSELGYTSIKPLKNIAKDAQIVTKGAFLINATLNTPKGHSH